MGFPSAQQLGRAQGVAVAAAAAARSARATASGGSGGAASPARMAAVRTGSVASSAGACRCLHARSGSGGWRMPPAPPAPPPPSPQRRSFFAARALLQAAGDDAAAPAKRKQPRSAGAKHSLRRVAVIAQQQPVTGSGGAAATAATEAAADEDRHDEAGEPGDEKDARVGGGDRPSSPSSSASSSSSSSSGGRGGGRQAAAPARTQRGPSEAGGGSSSGGHGDAYGSSTDGSAADGSNLIGAICVAESFDMERVMAILQAQGFVLDADGSGFESHEVVHARKRWAAAAEAGGGGGGGTGDGGRDVDVFVFESGTLVGWGLPADALDALAGRVATTAAAVDALGPAARETETLEFRRDAGRETSALRGSGDVVVLGTRREAALGDRLATTRAQIAFSSGLARSVKLAVLERSFTAYFESTRRIPEMLAGGDRRTRLGLRGWLGMSPPLSQKFILQKTGELLSLRAQLNHYRELTDALPDIFWDARAELGLEGYYEQVGRALDVGVRIKTLNQKMDYAQEIATVLREISSERHGSRLEWIIIVLITVEVVFELRRVWREGEGEER